MHNGQSNGEKPEKVLVYLGPSLALGKAKEILPGAIFRPPAKQSDIVSDVVELEPNRILLIDGEFRNNLSPWHKEIVYALQYPNVKGIYGASSMGALRASELDWVGMIGVGRIYGWYRDRITEDDSEVAVSYAELPGGEYRLLTVPLVDIRAGMLHYQQEFANEPVAAEARRFFEEMRRIYYMDRTPKLCEQVWDHKFGVSFPHVPQKELDAVELLLEFRERKSAGTHVPGPEHLTLFFQALYERERAIHVNGERVQQHHVDAYVMLHNPEWERIAWDASNQELALLLCDCLFVTVDMNEVQRENARFQRRYGIQTMDEFEAMLENNGWSRAEYDRLVIQNARIRKLQHAMNVSKMYRRNTQAVLDYLRTHEAFDFWAIKAAELERSTKHRGVDDWLSIDQTALELLAEHMEQEGQELKMPPEDYLIETGFSNTAELGLALCRLKAGKE